MRGPAAQTVKIDSAGNPVICGERNNQDRELQSALVACDPAIDVGKRACFTLSFSLIEATAA